MVVVIVVVRDTAPNCGMTIFKFMQIHVVAKEICIEICTNFATAHSSNSGSVVQIIVHLSLQLVTIDFVGTKNHFPLCNLAT